MHLASGRPSPLVLNEKRCFIIAEVAQTHDGSLGLAHAFIDSIAIAGADAVKFQTHFAEEETTIREPWRVPLKTQDASRFDYWKRMQFTETQWRDLRDHAWERGLYFISTPFSEKAVNLLIDLEVDAWKVASGEVWNSKLIEQMLSYPKPTFISSGMSPFAEVQTAVDLVRARKLEPVVLQCNSEYPCPPESVGLNVLAELRKRFDVKVGLSDHSGTIFPALGAFALGASVVEVHVTFSKEMFGPDVSSSVTFDELKRIVEGRNFFSKMLASPVNKDELAAQKSKMRSLFGKSIVARADLEPGIVLKESHLAFKKPGTGLPPNMLTKVLGQKIKIHLKRDDEIALDHLEAP